MRPISLIAAVFCLGPACALFGEHAPGESVRIHWAGEEVVAEVVSINSKSGWIKVKFRQNGLELTPVLPPDKVFASSKEYVAAEEDKEQKLLELLRTNSDGRNVSTTEFRPWHAPGKGAQKFGPVLFTARVKAFRAGSPLVLFETMEKGKKRELVVKYEQISNTDRSLLFELIKSRRKK